MSFRHALAVLAPSLAGVACHESSSARPSAPETLTSNLGLAIQSVYRSGDLQFFEVPEMRQGQDLNGDGDGTDRIAFVVDLERGGVVNTGLGAGFPHSAHSPPPIVTQGATLAFGVSEWDSGGLDRNGDGDIDDRVLGVYERDAGTVTNIGLAVRSAVSGEDVLACVVAEVDQGEDLDLDGQLSDATTVFVHDRRTGETWNIGTSGTTAVGVRGDFVSLSVDEAVSGDRNGDGDTLDLVFELYDAATRELHHVGLALTRIFVPMVAPIEHRGRWALTVTEADQGGADLDGDGDALDHVTFSYDPIQRTRRVLGQRIPRSVFGGHLVLHEGAPGAGFATQVVWLYDADTDLLVSTGLRGLAQGFDGRLVVQVDEDSQGEDLDRNGFFDGVVPVLHDLATGRRQSLGIDGTVQVMERGLLVTSRESVARRDWNGDGDREDSVLFTWDAHAGLVNTRLDPFFALPLGEDVALLVTDEAAVAHDLNGDGDTADHVLGTYDAGARRAANLGLAGNYVAEGAADRAVFSVAEWSQGVDLNGNGTLVDHVLHLTEILPQGR